jgi:hypothetical protein
MSIGKMLGNPVVLGGGAILGVVLLLHSSSGTAANASAAADAANPTVTSAAVDMNTAALGAQVQLATVSAQLGAAKFNADVTSQANVLNYLTSVDNNNTLLSIQQDTSAAGITNNLITSNASVVTDALNNAERLGEAYYTYAGSVAADNANVSVAKLQADAQKAVSKNSLIGTIAGTIGKVAGIGISAATGMPLGMGGMGF